MPRFLLRSVISPGNFANRNSSFQYPGMPLVNPRNPWPVPFLHFGAICYDFVMQKSAWFACGLLSLGFVLITSVLVDEAAAQMESKAAAKTTSSSAAGALEFSARITPTAARAEPVRQFTFYILTKSYTEIVKEAEERDPVPARDDFIDGLKLSAELRTWMKAKDTMDLSAPDMDKRLSPDDLLGVPEFLLAYQRSNSGGVTSGFPKPKFTDLDRAKTP